MVIVISHDETEAEYDVAVDDAYVRKETAVWDMLAGKRLPREADGRFKLKVPSWGVSVFLLGQEAATKPIREVQARLNQKDLSVPKYFADRPHLNEPEWDTPTPEVGK